MSRSYANPLRPLHTEPEVEFQDYDEIEIVSTFGVPEAEYAAIRKSTGLIDLPFRGLVELIGKDRLSFLNSLISNEVFGRESKRGIDSGQCVYAFLLDARSGRIACDMNVLELGERTLLEMDVRMVEPVLAALEKYHFSEQVKFVSRLGEPHEVALHGPGAQAIVSEIAGGIEELAPMRAAQTKIDGVDVVIWRDDPCAVPGYHLIVPCAHVGALWKTLVERFEMSGEPGRRRMRRIGWAAFNSTRIEGGRALFGIDFDNSILPAETGLLERAVSFTKGCYPGQEIVARMHARGQVARKIAGIRMADDALPIAGSKIHDAADNEVGGITSSTISPVLSNIAICLGLLKRPHFQVGTVLDIPAEGAMRKGTVVELPFVRT